MSRDMTAEMPAPGDERHAPLYVRAPYLQIRQQSDSRYVVMNVLTKKQYEFTPDACRLLQHFAAPRTIEELRDLFPGEPVEVIDDFIDYLRVRSLIIPAGRTGLNRAFQISRRNVCLFDCGEFDEERDPPSVVVVGIPFGHGNVAPNHAHRAPHLLRTFASVLSIRVDETLSGEQLSALYGHRIAWDGLIDIGLEQRLKDWGDLFIFGHERNDVVYDKIREMASSLFRAGHMPLFIGGDHSISFPLIEACAAVHGGLHVVHFDAHTDTYEHRLDEYYDDIATHHHGNFATRSMALDGVVAFHQFGIRGINNLSSKPPHTKQQIHFIGETREIASGRTTIDLPADAPYYVTLDIDVLDPSEAPGTSTPVPGGLRYAELIALIDRLLHDKRVVGIDLVEVDGEQDVNNVTAHIGAELLLLLLNYLRRDHATTRPDGLATR